MDGDISAGGKAVNRQKMQLDPGNLMLVVYTLVMALIILCGGVLGADASVEPAGGREPLTLEDLRQGELLVPGPAGYTTKALRLDQDVSIRISGIAARVTVTQEFENSSAEWVDGLYVFPLPEESAVDRLRMRVGEREIVGEIKEREEAGALFEKARQEGRKSSLLVQNRPNIFTTRVANIGPGERVRITIEYQQLAHYADTVFSLRFPMAITPRYIPGTPVEPVEKRSLTFAAGGWARYTDRVPDASQITPPVASPGSGEGPATRLEVELMSGFPLSRLESLYHPMETKKHGDDHYTLAFTGKVLADRDFVLEWQPEHAGEATAALLAEERGDNRYLLLMLLPPWQMSESHVPREAIFILDVSGSMAGPSIAQAREALRQALGRLQPSDSFNIISFSDSARALFAAPVPADQQRIAEAYGYLNSLKADGGTEMKPALELALDDLDGSERIRQVIFLTDGAVGNEEELLALIDRKLGSSRLFTVGIGSAPNSWFMSRAAAMGRGSFTSIGDVKEVQSRVAALMTKLEKPALTDISIRTGAGAADDFEVYPNPLPDLYYGEPLMVAIRTGSETGSFIVAGEQLGKRWEYTVDTSTRGGRPGIAALWARKKIGSEMESLALGKDESEVKKTILATALEHQLVSRYTSLVAVDERVSRPRTTPSQESMVTTAAPRGLQMEAVFGGGPATATPSALHILTGVLLVMTAGLLQLMRRRGWRR